MNVATNPNYPFFGDDVMLLEDTGENIGPSDTLFGRATFEFIPIYHVGSEVTVSTGTCRAMITDRAVVPREDLVWFDGGHLLIDVFGVPGDKVYVTYRREDRTPAAPQEISDFRAGILDAVSRFQQNRENLRNALVPVIGS